MKKCSVWFSFLIVVQVVFLNNSFSESQQQVKYSEIVALPEKIQDMSVFMEIIADQTVSLEQRVFCAKRLVDILRSNRNYHDVSVEKIKENFYPAFVLLEDPALDIAIRRSLVQIIFVLKDEYKISDQLIRELEIRLINSESDFELLNPIFRPILYMQSSYLLFDDTVVAKIENFSKSNTVDAKLRELSIHILKIINVSKDLKSARKKIEGVKKEQAETNDPFKKADQVFKEIFKLSELIDSIDTEAAYLLIKEEAAKLTQISDPLKDDFLIGYMDRFHKVLDALLNHDNQLIRTASLDFLLAIKRKHFSHQGRLLQILKKSLRFCLKEKDSETIGKLLPAIEVDLYQKNPVVLLLLDDIYQCFLAKKEESLASLKEFDLRGKSLREFKERREWENERNKYSQDRDNLNYQLKNTERAISVLINNCYESKKDADLSKEEKKQIEEGIAVLMTQLLNNMKYYMGDVSCKIQKDNLIVESGGEEKSIPKESWLVKKIMYLLDNTDKRQLDLVFLGLKNVLGDSLLYPYGKDFRGDYWIKYKLESFVTELDAKRIEKGINDLLETGKEDLVINAASLFVVWKELVKEKKLDIDLLAIENNVAEALKKIFEMEVIPQRELLDAKDKSIQERKYAHKREVIVLLSSFGSVEKMVDFFYMLIFDKTLEIKDRVDAVKKFSFSFNDPRSEKILSKLIGIIKDSSESDKLKLAIIELLRNKGFSSDQKAVFCMIVSEVVKIIEDQSISNVLRIELAKLLISWDYTIDQLIERLDDEEKVGEALFQIKNTEKDQKILDKANDVFRDFKYIPPKESMGKIAESLKEGFVLQKKKLSEIKRNYALSEEVKYIWQGYVFDIARGSEDSLFELEYFARNQMVESWGRSTLKKTDLKDPDLDVLLKVKNAGFLREYVFFYLKDSDWIYIPYDLQMEAFALWKAKYLKGHSPVILEDIKFSPEILKVRAKKLRYEKEKFRNKIKHVYVKMNDNENKHIAKVYLFFNGNREYSQVFNQNPTHIALTLDPGNWPEWQEYKGNPVEYVLPNKDGQYKLYAKCKKIYFESEVFETKEFVLDTVVPEFSFEINRGEKETDHREVTLYLTFSETASYAISLDGKQFSKWIRSESLSADKRISLKGGSGEKTIYVKVKDDVGNEALLQKKTIYLNGNFIEKIQKIYKSISKQDVFLAIFALIFIFIGVVLLIDMLKKQK